MSEFPGRADMLCRTQLWQLRANKRHRPGYSSARLRPRCREREVKESRRLVCLFWRCRDNLRLSHRLQTFVGRQSEHEAKCRGHYELGSSIATYEQETAGGEVRQRQDRGFSLVSLENLRITVTLGAALGCRLASTRCPIAEPAVGRASLTPILLAAYPRAER